MLYIPPAFRAADVPRLQDQMAASGLATLITVGAQGPLVSHLPLIFRPEPAPLGVLEGHLARGNPQWRDSDVSRQAVAMFMGPDAYVSPSWYASKAEHGRVVPTWNYSVICASGSLEFFDDETLLRDQVTRLTDRFESRFASPWKVSDAPADYLERQFKGIVGIRLRIEALEGKSKLSQNRPEADRAGVAAALRDGEHEAERSVAALMDRPDG
ncbi:MAG: FMN-binding negative transcriptional regulator [Pseudorhodoplanes sp.]|nr:FMN-binding negative transcriptional regulator [Pseudorhodoplanes sp.]